MRKKRIKLTETATTIMHVWGCEHGTQPSKVMMAGTRLAREVMMASTHSFPKVIPGTCIYIYSSLHYMVN